MEPEVVNEPIDPTETETTEAEGQEVEATFTQADLDREADKRISKALETARQKWEKEAAEQANKAAELAKMSAKERQEAEEKARLEEIDKREKELNMREYRYEAKRQLEENGMSDDFVDMVLSDDVETTKNNIDALKSAFDKAVEATVNERLKGNAPSVGRKAGSLTKAEILAVKDDSERQRLIAENLNLFS